MTPGFHDREDVLAVDADGSGLVDVTKLAAPCDASDPAWSPDGTKLAFDADCQDGFSDIWTIGADGSGRRQLTSQEATGEPAWSPDAKKLAYVSDRAGNADVWTMNADGSAKTRLTTAAGDDADPVWSPDGSSIAYVGERWSLCGARGPNKEIIVMNARGGAQRDVSNSCADDVSPSWQP
jgi:TolB protein